MIVERGNAALGIRIEVGFDQITVPIGDGPAMTVQFYSCSSCGSIVFDPAKHADFHYAIASRIGDGSAPGFAVGSRG